MARVPLLVDTDVFIDYFNTGRFSTLFDSNRFAIYYSVVTRKELLTKPGLREAERVAIVAELRRFRMVKLDNAIAARFAELRSRHPSIEKEDALIAASALVKRMGLVTKNRKHFRIVEELALFTP